MGLVDPLFETSRQRQTKAIMGAIDRQTSELLRAEGRTQLEIQYLQSEMSGVSEGIESLAATVQWGFGEITRMLAVQSELLGRAVAVLESPRATYANEARKMGIERFQNGWFDEASKEFERCLEAVSTDFLSFCFLAMIRMVNNDFSAAVDHALSGAKYAGPYSKDWASFAWLLAARSYFLEQNYGQAQRATDQALRLTPGSAAAHFENARVKVAVGDGRSALPALESAILQGPIYFDQSTSEPAFDPIRTEVESLQLRLLASTQERNESLVRESERLQGLGRQAQSISAGVAQSALDTHMSEMSEVRQSIGTDRYLGRVLAGQSMHRANSKLATTASQVIDRRATELENSESFLDKEYSLLHDMMGKPKHWPLTFGLVVATLVFFCGILQACGAWLDDSDIDVGALFTTPIGIGAIVAVLIAIAVFAIELMRRQGAKSKAAALREVRSRFDA